MLRVCVTTALLLSIAAPASAEIIDCNLPVIGRNGGYILDNYQVVIDRTEGQVALKTDGCDCDLTPRLTDLKIAEETDKKLTLTWQHDAKSVTGTRYYFKSKLIYFKSVGTVLVQLKGRGIRMKEARGTCTVK